MLTAACRGPRALQLLILAPDGVVLRTWRLGEADRIIIVTLQGLALFCLILAGVRFELGQWFHLGLVVAAGCFAWEYWKTASRKPQVCFKAFLHNHWAGLAILAGIVLDYATRA